MDIQRIDLFIINDGTESGAGKGILCLGVFPLQIIDMQCGGKGILMEIRQPQKCRKSHTPHAAHQRTLLGFEPVREHTLMPHQMQCFIFIRIIGLLKYCHIIRPTLMEIAVLITVDRIDFKAYISKIPAGQLTGLSDISYIALGPALAGQHQDFLNS